MFMNFVKNITVQTIKEQKGKIKAIITGIRG